MKYGAGRELCGYTRPPERGTRVTKGINDKMGLSYFGHVMRRQAGLFGKNPNAGENRRWQEKRKPNMRRLTP